MIMGPIIVRRHLGEERFISVPAVLHEPFVKPFLDVAVRSRNGAVRNNYEARQRSAPTRSLLET
jgi:hypothetical protein